MKVMLLKDVKSVGKKDQIVEVADGYGANYLIPRKLAVRADNTAINEAKAKEASKIHKIETEKAEAQALAEKLAAFTLKITASSGADDRLYGSITSKDIAEKLENDFGIVIDKRKILLADPIKTYGTYTIDVKLYTEITGKLNVVVCK